ncbi:MAG TPA: VIT1/CCC1 transporter family protein [Solirubrobacteraceae bacterium]|nr:VIT1/CCC1 transporter family protein [Solirubrobacteraceae bacterium]
MTPNPSQEVRERLLTAWRGEILAGAVYELIARRLAPREAEVMRRMAAAEGSHRQRLEQRMSQLGIPIPDPGSVRVPLWLRLQARVAPIDRLLAAREAAEDDEVDDLYKRSTGDPETDRLLHEIRREERSHSLAVAEMRAGTTKAASGSTARSADGASGRAGDGLGTSAATAGDQPGARTAAGAGQPALQTDPESTAQAAPVTPAQAAPHSGNGAGGDHAEKAKARLDRILGRERWHRRGGGWISGAIYGANDGLAAVFGIVAGVSGATNGSSAVLTAGLAGAIASALSMATGAFLAERSEAEVAAANLDRERQEIEEHPEEEKEELSLFYQLKGVDPETADQLAEQLARNPDAMLKALAAEEFGITSSDGGNPAQAAIAAGISTGIGAIVPVIPFMITTGTAAIVAAAFVSLAAHFMVGAAKSLVTLRSWWAAGLEMTLAGVVVGGALYAVGLALPS